MNTGYKIKELRIKKGLTQQELGDLLGIQKAAVNKYETGRVINLKHSTIKRLCEIFDVTPQELLGLENAEFNGDAMSVTSGMSPAYSDLKKLIAKLEKADQKRLYDYLAKLLKE